MTNIRVRFAEAGKESVCVCVGGGGGKIQKFQILTLKRKSFFFLFLKNT